MPRFISISPDAIPIPYPGRNLDFLPDELPVTPSNSERSKAARSNSSDQYIWKLCKEKLSIESICENFENTFNESKTLTELKVYSSLSKLYACNVITFTYPKPAVKARTYHSNGANVLKHVLDERGWREARPHDIAEFGCWFPSKGRIRLSKFQLFDFKLTRTLNHKSLLYQQLVNHNIEHVMPETHTSYEAFMDQSHDQGDFLWYVKLCRSGKQRGIFLFRGVEGIEDRVSTFGQKPYVIQKEVLNPYLIDNRKVNLRAHVLLLSNGSIYVHQNLEVRIQGAEYNKNDLGKESHFWVPGSTTLTLDQRRELIPVLPKIMEIIAQSSKPILQDVLAQERNRYSFLGVDFVVDRDFRPYLIEYNHTPGLDLRENGNPKLNELKLDVANGLLDIVLGSRQEPSVGNYTRAWPP